jgi:hypothetical protein
MQDKLNNYIIDLRKNHYKVAVYENELQRQFKREADFIAELNAKDQQEGSATGQPIEEMQKWITQPTLE